MIFFKIVFIHQFTYNENIMFCLYDQVVLLSKTENIFSMFMYIWITIGKLRQGFGLTYVLGNWCNAVTLYFDFFFNFEFVFVITAIDVSQFNVYE